MRGWTCHRPPHTLLLAWPPHSAGPARGASQRPCLSGSVVELPRRGGAINPRRRDRGLRPECIPRSRPGRYAGAAGESPRAEPGRLRPGTSSPPRPRRPRGVLRASNSTVAASLGTSGSNSIFQVPELGNGVFERINTPKWSESGSPRTAQDPDHGLAGRLVVLEKIQSFHSAFVSLGWRRTFNRSGRR